MTSEGKKRGTRKKRVERFFPQGEQKRACLLKNLDNKKGEPLAKKFTEPDEKTRRHGKSDIPRGGKSNLTEFNGRKSPPDPQRNWKGRTGEEGLLKKGKGNADGKVEPSLRLDLK